MRGRRTSYVAPGPLRLDDSREQLVISFSWVFSKGQGLAARHNQLSVVYEGSAPDGLSSIW